MTTKKVLYAVIFLSVLMTVSLPLAGQEHCKPFGGTVYAWHDGKAWVGEGNFLLGNRILHAKVSDVNTAMEKHNEIWWGTETATFDFGDGNSMELRTEFTTEHMKDPGGVFHVNEIGTFNNGKGSFRNASGHFNAQGPFGPGVVLPAGKVIPPKSASMFWIGHYDGVICGVR